MEEIYSYHIFYFPFIIQDGFVINDYWDVVKYQPTKNVQNYNQATYFYDFIEKVLFESNEDAKHYTFNKLTSDSKYNIETEKKGSFSLDIDKIELTIYPQFKIGILGFFLKNNHYQKEDVILTINDFGRRIYPQYLDSSDFVKSTKGSFLADKISLTHLSIPDIIEDFSIFENPPFEKKYISKCITQLIGDKIIEALDDRMFVCCLYNNSDKIRELKNLNLKGLYNYTSNNFWYQYIFIDNTDITNFSKKQVPKFLEKATYDRWLEYDSKNNQGTLYGISRYSFVVLGSMFITLVHLKDLYAPMVKLCLAQRASLIHFSDKVTYISNKGIESKEVAKIYREYISFRNKLFFREITAQEQGIELYDLLQSQMRIEKEVKDLDEEISELNNYIQSNEQAGLNKVATYFLPASLVTAILAFISDKSWFSLDENNPIDDQWWKYALLIIIVALSFFIGNLFLKNKKS